MSVKQKILLRIGAMITILAGIIIVIVMFNFRNYGMESALGKAQVVSELVKNGLTAHMVNGTMDKRDIFLKNIADMKDVNRLWVVRGEAVNKQYGPPLHSEMPRDNIDESVLSDGEMRFDLKEEISTATLRVTIPYKASLEENIDCLACHSVEVGETLGAVSVEFDVMNVRQEGISTILKILFTTFIAIGVIIVATNRLLDPYLELFESMKNSVKKAAQGIFDEKIETDLADEIGEMVIEYDMLLERLEDTFGTIDKDLRVFVAKQAKTGSNPLVDAGEIITSLRNLYQFKKAIELDVTKEEIYERLAYVLRSDFGAKNFTFNEIDSTAKEMHVVYESGEVSICTKPQGDCDLCRAKRTGTTVISSDFPNLCANYEGDRYHFCLPINIGGETGLVIFVETDTKEESKKLQENIAFIQSYANEAAPMIESKRLMKMLKDSSLKDRLTGLYNRRFLDEYVEKLGPQVIRQQMNVGILMIDMDHFKKVNDTYGHDIGDAVLKELAIILNNNVRESDLVIRYGGEEFIVLLIDIGDDEKMMEIADKLRQKVSERYIDIGNNKTLQKTISIGTSSFPADTESIWQSIKFADIALYEAKKTGRNRVVRFTFDLWDDYDN